MFHNFKYLFTKVCYNKDNNEWEQSRNRARTIRLGNKRDKGIHRWDESEIATPWQTFSTPIPKGFHNRKTWKYCETRYTFCWKYIRFRKIFTEILNWKCLYAFSYVAFERWRRKLNYHLSGLVHRLGANSVALFAYINYTYILYTV